MIECMRVAGKLYAVTNNKKRSFYCDLLRFTSLVVGKGEDHYGRR